MSNRPLSQGQMDVMARHAGFRDYATWAAWNQQRQSSLQQPSGQPAQQPNFLQSLINKIPIHPSYLLNYVNDKIKQATGE